MSEALGREHGLGESTIGDQVPTVAFRTRSTPSMLEYPLTIPITFRYFRVHWVRLPRGPLVFEVEMPARPNPRLLLAPILAIVPTALFAAFIAGHIDDDLALPVLYAGAAALLVTFLVWLIKYRPAARNETLEIDSHVVALRRDSEYLCAWDRAAIEDVGVAPDKIFRMPGRALLGGTPSIVWGESSAGFFAGGAGAGISREEAKHAVARIQEFIALNPRDPMAPSRPDRLSVR